MDFDVIVIGSGFGGSVSALRLSEQGYQVGVLEQGRRFSRENFQNAKESMCDLIWMPGLGLKGCFTQRFFRYVNVVGGLAVIVIPAPIIGAILWQRGYQWSFIIAGLISLIGLGLFIFSHGERGYQRILSHRHPSHRFKYQFDSGLHSLNGFELVGKASLNVKSVQSTSMGGLGVRDLIH